METHHPKNQKQKLHIAFLPYPSAGHLTPALHLAHHLLLHHQQLAITIIVLPPPSPSPHLSSLLSSPSPNLSFHHLPLLPTTSLPSSPSPTHYLHLYRTILRSTLSSLFPLHALVLDLFASPLLDLPRELGTPAFVFCPSSAALLALLLLRLPSLPTHQLLQQDTIDVPGFSSPFPISSLPTPFLHDTSSFLDLALSLREAKGIIVNSFAELEPLAFRALEGSPVYPVGPLARTRASDGRGVKHECIRWLDEQPRGTVVYVCFGSRELLGREGAREVALGLERSGHRFLWVTGREEIPEGFEARTAGRGKVWNGWAPQGEVLGHVAVGGFVTHCGWNSVMEGVRCGVGMVTWPLGAEQRMNAVELVEEVGAGVRVGEDGVEGAVRVVMGEGSGARERAREMEEKGRRAVEEGGSSHAAMQRLVRDLAGGSFCFQANDGGEFVKLT